MRKRKCRHGDVGDIGCHDIEDSPLNVDKISQKQDCNRKFCPAKATSPEWETWFVKLLKS